MDMAQGVSPPAFPPANEIMVASHADKVLMSLAAVRAPDNVDGSARTEEVVVATQADKVLANLADVQRDSRARHVLAKRALLDGEPVGEQHVSAPPADETTARDAPAIEGVSVAMSDSRLDRVRGGFSGDNGLQISFGIERAVYINGTLTTTTSLNITNLGKVTAGSGQAVNVPGLPAIQIGAGNTFSASSPTSVTSVIQNTLDGQKIQNLTVINATVNSLQVLKGLQLQSVLTNAIADSLRR
jgi:hypothetical protein